jgi:hypothetical protein
MKSSWINDPIEFVDLWRLEDKVVSAISMASEHVSQGGRGGTWMIATACRRCPDERLLEEVETSPSSRGRCRKHVFVFPCSRSM